MHFRKLFFIVCVFLSHFSFSQSDSLLVYAYPRGTASANGVDVGVSDFWQLPPYILNNKKIKRISFYSCPGIKMETLIPQLKSFPDLVAVAFIECGFGKFPEELCGLTNLRALTIAYDNIDEVPESISRLSNLEFLDLGDALYGGDNISKLPESMSQLKKLRVFYFMGNGLTSLPENMTSLPLTFLNMRYNNLKDLSTIEQLPLLEDLDIGFNHLQTLPGIEKMHALKSLDVTGCELTNETANFDQLVNLEILEIGYNEKINLEETINRLSKLPHLKELELENDSIKKMPASISNFPALENLSLDQCSELDLNQIFPLLSKIASLRELSLRQCELKKLPANIILLQQLNYLDLYFNNLKTTDGLCDLKNLQKLYMCGNPLNSFDNCMRNLNLTELYLPEELPEPEINKAKKFFPAAEVEVY